MQIAERRFVYVPENFSPEAILPDTLTKFADDTRYFIHKIYEQRVLGARSKDDFIPLKAEYLRKIISFRKYSEIKNILVESKTLESDNHWIKGHKATGFRLGERHRNVKHKKIQLTNKRLIENIDTEEAERETKISLETHKFLYGCLKKIEINYEQAISLLDDEDFTSGHISIEMIKDKKWFFHPDEYGRVHSNLTNLKSCLRETLSVEGKSLRELDIACSQPFFFGVILITYLSNSKKLISYNLPSHHSIRCDILPPDVTRYLELVQTGTLYDYLAEKFNVPFDNRRKFKVKLFSEIFFCKNAWKSKLSEQFQKEFPTVYEVVQDLKAKDYTALSKLLQKVESSFIINKVVRRLMVDEDLFVGTIHDSFLVHQEIVPLVQQIVQEEFEPWGLQPTVREK